MSTYLFNNKRDQETNKLMGVVIFLILSLVFTIVISVSVFLVYFDDYLNIQRQYTLLEEKLQEIRIENYEKNSDFTRLNVELNQFKNEVNKLTLEKEISDKNVKFVSDFINSINTNKISESRKFLHPDIRSKAEFDNTKMFPSNMVEGEFVLNDNLESGTVTYFHTKEGEKTNRYIFNMTLENEEWFISDVEFINNNEEAVPMIN